MDLLRNFSRLAWRHRYGFSLIATLAAAALTGAACVCFMWGFEFVLERRMDFSSAGPVCWLLSPLTFLLAVELIRRAAPCAAGTGIPQAIFAAHHLSPSAERALAPLTSLRTMAVKILALYVGVWAGASTGREGPTVHIATCVFTGILLFFRKFGGIEVDLRSAVIAGGAAGLGAAFNTPLAGVTFAIEELSGDYFGSVKDFVLLAIIVAALTAKSLTGEYAYFGKVDAFPEIPASAVLLIGLLGGILGAAFSTLILRGQEFFERRGSGASRWLLPPGLALVLLAIAWTAGTSVLGPGNGPAQAWTRGEFSSATPYFLPAKMAATLCTYWSGIAGGIFAPCLAMGAALGASVGNWLALSVASCALVGMAAFLSGAIQAPITAFVILFEMTGHHHTLLPIMLGSLLAFMAARLLGARHLYQALAEKYGGLLR